MKILGSECRIPYSLKGFSDWSSGDVKGAHDVLW